MQRKLHTLTLLFILLIANICCAEAKLHVINIGDLTTTSGETLTNCKIAYRTIGTLNAEKSNVLLWPTWFGGTSEDVITSGYLAKTIDTNELYVVIVDALTNGVSSSPSNTLNCPAISVRDMVNSQHTLLVKHLGINHVRAIAGVSLGGMQTFEWLVAFPNFMDKAITILGTPALSAFDVLVLQTQVDLLTNAGCNAQRLDFALKKSYDIFLMNLTTPTHFSANQSANNVQTYLDEQYKALINPYDYLAALKAMLGHNIYKSAHSRPDEIGSLVNAEILVIVSSSDHLVDPINAIAFAQKTGNKLLVLEGNNGHLAPYLQAPQVLEATSVFLR